MDCYWGDQLKACRKAAHLSQQQLADKLGISSRTVSFWETGTRGMTLEHAEMVFGAFGLKLTLTQNGRFESGYSC